MLSYSCTEVEVFDIVLRTFGLSSSCETYHFLYISPVADKLVGKFWRHCDGRALNSGQYNLGTF